ncbi:MAG TPA: hypothetical protein PK947_05865 [Ottowia sp.]|jgi:predicted transcriptional regulator|nr:hypothetical protein [Ottowia sp.]
MNPLAPTLTPTLTPTRAGVADREVVEALRDMIEVLSVILIEFPDAIDRATVRDAMQKLLDVALVHDALGNYHVYRAIDVADVDAELQP